LLGPVNWFTDEDRQQWWPALTVPAVRPEQLLLRPAEDAVVTVEQVHVAGSQQSITLRHEVTGDQRTVRCSPPLTQVSCTDRVRLDWRVIAVLLTALWGCDQGAVPLAVEATAYWTLPPEGHRLPAPRAVTATETGVTYVLDNAGRVLVLDEQGECLRWWWMPEFDVGKPERLLVCRDGRLAVADTHYHRVVMFSDTGEVLQTFGAKGTGPGEFVYPVAIAEDDREQLYVCEYGGHDRIQVFDRQGNYQREFGKFGTGRGEFQRPSGIVWNAGRLYVADAFNNRLHVFEDSGKLVTTYDDTTAGLHYPYDVGLGPQGDLFVVEYGAGRVTRLSASGQVLGRYGQTGGGPTDLSTPWGLSVDHRGQVYVADTGNRRIVRLQLR
jgi:sugar lactone lactonase YvrE